MKKRKILSLLLSLCLLIGLLPTATLAADQTNDGAGIRIQYVDGSYDKTTGIMKVRVQAKLPSGSGIKALGVVMTYDNTKLTLVNQNNNNDLAGVDGTKQSPKTAAIKILLNGEDEFGSTNAYSISDGELYRSDDRCGLYAYLYTIDTPESAQKTGNWFDCYEVMFRVAGKPADPSTVLNSDSLRIADVAKGDAAVMKGAFPANDIYSIYLTDDSTPAKLYVLNRMSGCTATEVTGEKSLMTAPETGTATYPGSTNSPSATTYTVSFDANGGTGSMGDVTGVSGEYTLPANGFTAPDGKQFKAWSVGGVEKAVGDKITVTANTTVTAVWENIPVVTYTVSFDANGGTGTMANVTDVSGEYTLPANGFTAPSGKQFKAWSVGGVEKAAGDKITVTANTTVTAIWEPIPATEYTITFNGNGGTPSVSDMTTVSKKLSSLPTATHSGSYSFNGWYTAASGGTKVTTSTIFNANTTIYAQWTYTGGSVVIIPDTDETDKSEPENPGTGAAVNPGTGAAAAGSSFGYPFVALAAVHAIYAGTKKLAKKDED